ncbi:hypothetical protein J6590_038227 [Homalodisca vitripennis]|nr:hypothetical protein J6590_038227 [Homalodisca vitripennis]
MYDCQTNASTPKVLKTRIKLCLASNAFYSVDEFLAFNWETTREETDSSAESGRNWHGMNGE